MWTPLLMVCIGLLRKYWRRFFSISLVCSLGLAIMSGMSSVYLSAQESLTDYVRDLAYPDGIVTTELDSLRREDKILAVDGIEGLSSRARIMASMEKADGNRMSVVALTYDGTSQRDLSRFHVWDIADGGGLGDGLLLEYRFARENDISVGDEVRLALGGETRTVTVSGIVSSPEALALQPIRGLSLATRDFGCVYVDTALLADESEAQRDRTSDELAQKSAELASSTEEAADAYAQANAELEAAARALEEAQGAWQSLLAQLRELPLGEQADIDAIGRPEQATQLLETVRDTLMRADRELVTRQPELESARSQLDAAAAQVDEARGRLQQARDARAEAVRALQAIQQVRETMGARELTTLVDHLRIRAAGGDSEISRDELVGGMDQLLHAGEAASQAARDLGSMPPETSATVTESVARMEGSLGPVLELWQGHSDEAQLRVLELAPRFDQLGDDEKGWLRQEFGDDALTTMEALPEIESQVVRTYDDLTEVLDNFTTTCESQLAEIDTQLAEQGVDATQLDDTIATMDAVRGRIDDGYNQLNSAQDLLNGELARVRDALPRVTDAVEQLSTASGPLLEQLGDDGRSVQEQLDDARALLDERRATVEAAWQDAQAGLSEAGSRLGEARASLCGWEGYESYRNQYLLYFKPGADPERTLAAAMHAMGRVMVLDDYTYEDSPVWTRVDADLDPLRTLSIFMPIIFFGVVLMVVSLLISLIVRQCRVEIGIMRALGFAAVQVRALFCATTLTMALASVPLGIAIGMSIMRVTNRYLHAFYALPAYQDVVSVRVVCACVLVVALVATLAAWLGTRFVREVMPSEAMSRAMPSSVRVSRTAEWFTRHASGLLKFSVISATRNKVRLALSAVCVAATFMLIFSSLSFVASKNQIVSELFNKRIHYDCQVFMNGAPGSDLLDPLSELGYVREIQPRLYYEREFTHGDLREDGIVSAMSTSNTQLGVLDTRGEAIDIPRDGIVLESRLAKSLNVQIGDTVEVRGKPLKVTGITRQNIVGSSYVSLQTAQAWGDPQVSSLLIDIDKRDEQRLLDFLAARNTYFYCQFANLMEEALSDVYANFDVAAWTNVGFAVLIGLLVIVNITQTNMLDRRRELCVFRTLGFSRAEISRNMFAHELSSFVLAAMVGIPLGRFVTQTLLAQLSTANRSFAYSSTPAEYALTLAIVFAYVVASHVAAMRMLHGWSITEGVKEHA